MPSPTFPEGWSDAEFRLLWEALPGIHILLAPDRTIVAVSDAYLAATHALREELLGRDILEVFPGGHQDPDAPGTIDPSRSLRQALTSARPDALEVRRYEIPRPIPLGGGHAEHHWRILTSPVLDVGGRLRFLILQVEDHTDLVRLQKALHTNEERLRQVQKMEAVGQLASGIAHDFNNLLTVVLSGAERLEQKLGHDRNLEAIRHAAGRAARLTQQLLAFGRQQTLTARSLDLDEVLRGLLPILNRTLGEDIELVVRPAHGLWKVVADPGQIEQVILNLVVNARDAMPEGGRLTLGTANVDLDDRSARDHPGTGPGPHVMLAVSDTGLGMDAETQARAFDPFFTTKARGKGTGLGLATVFGIVKQAGGHIWLDSRLGVGTTFKIYLPATPAGGASDPDGPDTTAEPDEGGDETVLLVEDEAQVRGMAAEVLRSAGYAVLEAQNGSEALEVCTRHRNRIDLLITDVIMPGMNGRRISDVATSIRSDLAVLFMSGYPEDAILRHGVMDYGIPFLQKPFTPSQLRMKVREALQRSRHHA